MPGEGCCGTKLFLGLETSEEWPADAVGSPLLPSCTSPLPGKTLSLPFRQREEFPKPEFLIPEDLTLSELGKHIFTYSVPGETAKVQGNQWHQPTSWSLPHLGIRNYIV